MLRSCSYPALASGFDVQSRHHVRLRLRYRHARLQPRAARSQPRQQRRPAPRLVWVGDWREHGHLHSHRWVSVSTDLKHINVFAATQGWFARAMWPCVALHGFPTPTMCPPTASAGASAGIAFAIPSSVVRRVVPQLIQFGTVQRASLGFQPAADPIARSFKVRRPSGNEWWLGQGCACSELASATLLGTSCLLCWSKCRPQAWLHPAWCALLHNRLEPQVSEGVLIQTADPQGAAAKAGLLPTRRGLGGIVPGEPLRLKHCSSALCMGEQATGMAGIPSFFPISGPTRILCRRRDSGHRWPPGSQPV